MFLKRLVLSCVLIAPAFGSGAQDCNLLCNGGFDSLVFTTSLGFVQDSVMPCWHTDAPDSLFEVWANGNYGVPAYDGPQYIELNAYYASTVSQSFPVTPGGSLSISFAHRGRAGVDTMSVAIGPAGGPDSLLGYFADGDTAWGYYTLNYGLPLSGNAYVVSFTAVSSAINDPTIGNFLDAVEVCETTTGIAENGPTAVSVYPSPFTDFLYVERPSGKPARFRLYDARSRLAGAWTLPSGKRRLDVPAAGDGLYYYELLYDDGRTVRGKILKTGR